MSNFFYTAKLIGVKTGDHAGDLIVHATNPFLRKGKIERC